MDVKYGRLEITSEPFREKSGQSTQFRTFVLAKCECGKEGKYALAQLRCGKTKSCGCLKAETKANLKHGLVTHPLHIVWQSMRQRCLDSKHKAYKHYGARGIAICAEWNDFKVFYDWAIGKWQQGLELDREDNDGNYEPSNCRFITAKENIRNRGWNKLDMADAVEIRTVYSGGHITQKELGFLFNTSKSNIGNVVRHKTWA